MLRNAGKKNIFNDFSSFFKLMDKRCAGMAVGVGTCKILGKVHSY